MLVTVTKTARNIPKEDTRLPLAAELSLPSIFNPKINKIAAKM
jgi:hypothetical protein